MTARAVHQTGPRAAAERVYPQLVMAPTVFRVVAAKDSYQMGLLCMVVPAERVNIPVHLAAAAVAPIYPMTPTVGNMLVEVEGIRVGQQITTRIMIHYMEISINRIRRQVRPIKLRVLNLTHIRMEMAVIKTGILVLIWSKNNGRRSINGGSRSDSRPDHGAYSVGPDRYEEIQSECDSVRRSPVCQDGPESAQPREYARRMVVVTHAGRSSAGPAAHQLAEQTRPS